MLCFHGLSKLRLIALVVTTFLVLIYKIHVKEDQPEWSDSLPCEKASVTITALIVTEAFYSCSSIEKQTDWTVDKRSYKIQFELLFLELLDNFT